MYYQGTNYGDSFKNVGGLSLSYPYLEIIEFFNREGLEPEKLIDRNSSIDTYKAGDYYVDREKRAIKDPGWGDRVYYWLNRDVPSGVNSGKTDYLLRTHGKGILEIYDFDNCKVNLVCHSMGGLAAREYLRLAGASNVDKLITVGTPHLGAKGATRTNRIVLGTQRWGWFMCPAWSFAIQIADGILQRKYVLDIDGDAIVDMKPSSDFLSTLNSGTLPSVKYYMIVGFIRWNSGDGVVSFDSQEGTGVLPPISNENFSMIWASHDKET
ncbi:hypothetical protein KAI19_00270, partial [bacterium]|nr:hypothetical protein [bacterium]